MAEALDPTLGKKEFHNWLKGAMSVLFAKGAMSVLFAKEGLSEFVQTEVTDFRKDLINTVFTQNGIAPSTICASCTTANVLSCPTANFCSKGRRCNKHDKTVPGKTPNIQCPKKLCNGLKDGICNMHRYNQPAWQNSDATKWCADAFEMAKCFMPPDGYSNKRSLADTDFNGMIAIIINNKRFQNKMTAKLNTQHNTCSKARDIINETIRHSGSNELSDLQLAHCIDALRDVLVDSNVLLYNQHAQVAVNKLSQIKNNTLTISAGDITRALEENIRHCLSQQQQEALEEIRKVADDKKQELLQLSHTHNENVLLDDAGNKTSPLWRLWNKITFKEIRLRSNLKEDIITYYREHESVIPASPLVDEHNVPIEDLYVLPPMWAYENSYFGHSKNRQKGDETSGNDGQKKQKITISQLFVSNVRHRKIYITANAGFGKTSLSQQLTMTWCQSQSPLISLKTRYKGEDLAAMKYFDLLFLLHLRDYQSEVPKCNLDDLIMLMVSKKLSRSTEYSQEFIQRLLHKNTCLIILDGLDEWAHPDPAHCTRKPEVPHNNHPENCTVLMTTRDWKIGTVGLSPKDIDRRVEISMLDSKSRDLLEKNALGILNERNLNLEGTTIEDFDKEVKRVKIGDIICIPYILLQLMCLFFGGLPIGKSKCQIYSNITEFTLKRGLNKKDLPDIHVQSNDNAVVLNCMKKSETCKRYFTLLMKLGKLAFYTLFSEKKESSLIFDRRIVDQYMAEQEIELCLKVGLLCQTKDSSIIAVKRFQVSFQHKSIQEFFSAIYIMSEWQNESVKSTIIKTCSTISNTLEMENLFVFVCGMNPEVYTCISGELQKIVDLDGVTCRFDFDWEVADTILSYQSMQVQCLQESLRNENESCPIDLYVVLDMKSSNMYTSVDLTALKTIIHLNKCHVKSLLLPCTSLENKQTEFLQSLDPGVFTSLVSLRLQQFYEEPVWLADILTESARTLKCLTLSLGNTSLSAINISALIGLTCLQSLYLAWFRLIHSNFKCLFDYISKTTTLTQLELVFLHCSDHKDHYHDCDVTLDLHRLNKLKMLHLYVPYRGLHVNPACLEKFKLDSGRQMTTRASAILWQDLRAAPVLSSLTLHNIISCQEMIQTIPTLTQLQYLRLVCIYMDGVISLSPAMTQLERLEMCIMTMSSAAWQELFLSFDQLPQSITVKLSYITMTSQE